MSSTHPSLHAAKDKKDNKSPKKIILARSNKTTGSFFHLQHKKSLSSKAVTISVAGCRTWFIDEPPLQFSPRTRMCEQVVVHLETLISFCQYFCSPWCLKIYLLLPPHYSSVKIAWLGWPRKMAVPISSRRRKNSVLNWYFRAKYINTQTKCIIYLKSKLVFILRDVHDTSVSNTSCQCHPHLRSSGTPTQLLSCLDNNFICDGWKQKVMQWRWLLVCLLQQISSLSTSV